MERRKKNRKKMKNPLGPRKVKLSKEMKLSRCIEKQKRKNYLRKSTKKYN